MTVQSTSRSKNERETDKEDHKVAASSHVERQTSRGESDQTAMNKGRGDRSSTEEGNTTEVKVEHTTSECEDEEEINKCEICGIEMTVKNLI